MMKWTRSVRHIGPMKIYRTQKILKVWTKEKKGLPVTWENLIKTLRECGMMGLARTLEDTKIRGMTHLHTCSYIQT